MKDIKFILVALASNLASLAVTQYVVRETWNHLNVGPETHRSLQDDCCDCPARICNGLASNCNQPANAIMYASLHNAMASRDEGFLAPNHSSGLEEALDAGFRGLLLDSCDCDGTEFCHGFCFAGTRNPTTVFANILTFLKANPNEVIVVELQIDDNTLFSLWEKTSSDFRDLIYSHPIGTSTPWPTLNELIDMKQRLIVFQHNGGNCDAQGGCPIGVHDMWDFGFETRYDLTGADELEDYSKSCTVRTGQASNQWFLNNHFANNGIGLPDRNIAEEVNTAQVLQTRLDACTTMLGRRTNLLVVDHWDLGDVVQVVMDNNAALGDDVVVVKAALDGDDLDEEESNADNVFLGGRFGDKFGNDDSP
mmetsp:Transcript_19515/g.32392  ORF Transcript_19515/g.32392 Transcript_19515/m.32392 type:complete len:365 (-) Transcript_19515:198-1292(-)